MKRLSLYIVLVLVGLIFLGATEVSAQKKMKKEAVIWPAEDIKWEQLKGGPPGVMIANLWGNYEKGEVKKVVLLYSGGLDTSVMLKWIQDEYNAEVIALTVDLGQHSDDLEEIRKKALTLGAKKAFVVDAKDEAAIAFYRHHGFIALPESPRTLFLPLATVR